MAIDADSPATRFGEQVPRALRALGMTSGGRAPDDIAPDFDLPADLEIEPGQLTIPDLVILPPDVRFRDWGDAPRTLLVIEVLSPSTARYDRGLKRRFYQRTGVPEYGIVDPDGRVVERWRPGADVTPLVLELPALFAAAAGE